MTLISHRAQFIFLKTHKTAGTSVEAALEPLCLPPGAAMGPHYRAMSVCEAGIIGARGAAAETAEWRNHMSARAVRRALGHRLWRRYFKLSIVRNPYDRMVSMYFSRLSATDRATVAGSFELARDGFRAWLRTANARRNLDKLLIGLCYQPDHVLFYETLAQDFAALAGAWQLSVDLPRFKADRRVRAEPWQAFYDEPSRRIVAAACAFELAYYGYDFEGGPRPATATIRAGRLLRAAPHLIAAARHAPQARSFPKVAF